MKKTLIIVLSAIASYGFAQAPQPMATPTYPTAGVSTEHDFSSELSLPLVNAPIPSTNPKAAVTPQQMYSPNTNGGTYSAAELQAGSQAVVVSNGAGASGGATGGATVAGGGSNNGEAAVGISSLTTLPRKKKFVSADEVLNPTEEEESEEERQAQRITVKPGGPSGPQYGPVGDGVWVLLLLATAYVLLRKRGVSR